MTRRTRRNNSWQNTFNQSNVQFRSDQNAATVPKRNSFLIEEGLTGEPPPPTAFSPAKKSFSDALWMFYCYLVTWWAPSCILRCFGWRRRSERRAFREKVGICLIIFLLSCVLVFVGFGSPIFLCATVRQNARFTIHEISRTKGDFNFIGGQIYYNWRLQKLYPDAKFAPNTDLTFSFMPMGAAVCRRAAVTPIKFPCESVGKCFNVAKIENDTKKKLQLAFEWSDVSRSDALMVINGAVLDMSMYLAENRPFLGAEVHRIVRRSVGRDATMSFAQLPNNEHIHSCLTALYKVGSVCKEPLGCFFSHTITYLAFVLVSSVLLARYMISVYYNWFLSPRIKNMRKKKASNSLRSGRQTPDEMHSSLFSAAVDPQKMSLEERQAFLQQLRLDMAAGDSAHFKMTATEGTALDDKTPEDPYTVLFVTCYSEGEKSIRSTLESLGKTTYDCRRKLIFIVADGCITGSGNDRSTPEIVLEALQVDLFVSADPPALYCDSIAEQHAHMNRAKTYVGHVECAGTYTPVVVVVKTGLPSEFTSAKAGNRGKRDSQILLMQFFQRILLDDLLTPFEFDLCNKIFYVTGVSPDAFENVLMVDSDTRVHKKAVTRLVDVLRADPMAIGLCGETQIANKFASWVTMIQVFEYRISHFLGKSFESAFGGVTCLPGCCCMYRLKVRKNGQWVPILTAPSVVSAYAETVVDTLHKVNLLHLGEDRYLTALMLKLFPRRKLMFVPSATCRTTVPHTFRMLLSQRRRWTNSTLNNLWGLLKVRNLCGAFCCSMRYMILVDLVGIATAPAAFGMLVFLVVMISISRTLLVAPIAILGATVLLPPLLVFISRPTPGCFFWFVVYIAALPVWQCIFPLYAFWHLDDFSWGRTRATDDCAPMPSKGEGKLRPPQPPPTGRLQNNTWRENAAAAASNASIESAMARAQRASVAAPFAMRRWADWMRVSPDERARHRFAL